MGHVAIWLVVLAWVYTGECVSTDQLNRATKVFYNPNRTTDENIYNILRFYCPESVYCECQDKNSDECRKMIEMKYEEENNMQATSLIEYIKETKTCCTPCYCDEDCYNRGNCCRDMPQLLHQEKNNTAIKECVPATNEIYDEYVDVNVLFKAKSYFMVTKCQQDYSSSEVVSRCHSPSKAISDEVTIVSSRVTDTIYRNIYCAMCNHEHDITTWSMLFNLLFRKLHLAEDKFPVTYEELLELDRRSVVYFEPSNGIRIHPKDVCIFSEKIRRDICPPPTDNSERNYIEFLKHACHENNEVYFYSSIFFRTKFIKNVFCFLCSKNEQYVTSYGNCDDDSYRSISGFLLLLTGSDGGTPTETIETINIESNEQCKCLEWYDKEEDICRPILCPIGMVQQGCGCVNRVQYVSGMELDVRLEIIPDDPNLTQDTNIDYLKDVYTKPGLVNSILGKVTATMLAETSRTIIFDKLAMVLIQPFDRIHHFYLIARVTAKPKVDTRDNVRKIYQMLWNGKNVKVQSKSYKIRLGLFHDLDYRRSEGKYIILLKNTSEIHNVAAVYRKQLSSMPIRLYPFNTEKMRKLIFCETMPLLPNETYRLDRFKSGADDTMRILQYTYSETREVMCYEDFLNVLYPSTRASAYSVDQLRYIICYLLVMLGFKVLT